AWSSDVCSPDLARSRDRQPHHLRPADAREHSHDRSLHGHRSRGCAPHCRRARTPAVARGAARDGRRAQRRTIATIPFAFGLNRTNSVRPEVLTTPDLCATIRFTYRIYVPVCET